MGKKLFLMNDEEGIQMPGFNLIKRFPVIEGQVMDTRRYPAIYICNYSILYCHLVITEYVNILLLMHVLPATLLQDA